VFAYLGLTFFSQVEKPWSWQFILVEIFIIIIGRLAGTVGLISLLSLCKVKKQVSYKQLTFIGYSGMIRGAIAFGLVLTIDGSIEERDVIITTSLSLVIITTLLFGSTMPMI